MANLLCECGEKKGGVNKARKRRRRASHGIESVSVSSQPIIPCLKNLRTSTEKGKILLLHNLTNLGDAIPKIT